MYNWFLTFNRTDQPFLFWYHCQWRPRGRPGMTGGCRGWLGIVEGGLKRSRLRSAIFISKLWILSNIYFFKKISESRATIIKLQPSLFIGLYVALWPFSWLFRLRKELVRMQGFVYLQMDESIISLYLKLTKNNLKIFPS